MKNALITAFAVLSLGVVLPAQQPSQQQDSSTPQPAHPQQQTPAMTQQPPASTTQSGTAAQAATSEPNASRIAPGSIIPARLTKTVDAKKIKKGDTVVATVPGDLKATSGQVLVPKDTKVIGHVTEAQPRSKDQKESQLGIAFDQMTMKDGQQVNLPMSIQAVVAPQNRQPGGDSPSPGSAPNASTSNAPGGGARGGSMGGNYPQPQNPPQAPEQTSTIAPTASAAEPITENTQGVVGIPNVSLSAGSGGATGSVLTSEKNNVKLEDGTMLLLRVSPSAQPSPQTQQNSPSPNPQQ